MTTIRLTSISLIALALVVGAGLGWFLNEHLDSFSYKSYREKSTEYNFITPLLFVDIDEELALPRFSELKQALTKYANTSVANGTAKEVSIYFRNLNTSQWIGVNIDEKFAPASMLKVVTLMGVLRASEDNPALLSKRIRLLQVEEAFPVETNPYPPENPIRSGEYYSIDSLLRHLVVESDNAANFALSKFLGKDKLRETYEDLALEWQPDDLVDPGYTAREYSRVFRALYNGTYLSRSLSEQVLSLLSTTTFDKGIVAGVPAGTTVSHKFGVRDLAKSKEAVEKGDFIYHELHDCGIVYFPEDPYFLCVMTRGDDLTKLESVIQEASRITWEERSEI